MTCTLSCLTHNWWHMLSAQYKACHFLFFSGTMMEILLLPHFNFFYMYIRDSLSMSVSRCHSLSLLFSFILHIQSTLYISNNDISKYLLISKNTVETYFLFLFTFLILLSKTVDISKKIFWNQKICIEISVVWYDL